MMKIRIETEHPGSAFKSDEGEEKRLRRLIIELNLVCLQNTSKNSFYLDAEA